MFNGLVRGSQLIADFFLLFARVLPRQPNAIPDFVEVANIWLGEVTYAVGEFRKVKTNWFGIPNVDPAQSREALRRLKAKYS